MKHDITKVPIEWLITMIENESEFKPEAIIEAKQEIRNRKIESIIKNNDEYETK